MKLKASLASLSIVLAALTACSHTASQSDRVPSSTPVNWKFESARYTLNDVVNAKTGRSVMTNLGPDSMSIGGGNGYQECRIDLAERDVILGDIEITLVSTDTYIWRRQTIRIPAIQAKLELTGLEVECHSFRKNSSWAIRGLSGKTVKDIFASEYTGVKAGGSLAFLVAGNLNGAVARNASGVTITNVEQMLNLADFGIGLTVAFEKIKFDQSDLSSKNQSVSITNRWKDGRTESSSSSSFIDALKIKL